MRALSAGASAGVRPPEGWAVSALELMAAGGEGVLVLAPLRLGEETVEALADRERRRLAQRLPGFESGDPRRHPGENGDVLVLPYSWKPDEGARRHEVRLLSSRGVAGTVRWSAPASHEAIDSVAELVDTFAFHAPGELERTYSTAELTALAELLGASSFPSTGDHRLASEPARLDARRALRARGILESPAPGCFEVNPVDRALLSVALDPRAVVRVGHRRGRAEQRCQIYLGSELGVAHSSVPIGVHRLEVLPAAMLAPSLAQLGELEERPVGHRQALDLSVEEFDRLRDRFARAGDAGSGAENEAGRVLSAVRSSTQVFAVAERPRRVNATVAWIDAGDELGLWTIARSGERVSFSPDSADRIQGHLDRLAGRLVEATA